MVDGWSMPGPSGSRCGPRSSDRGSSSSTGLLTLGALLLVGGSLGDILGRRRIFAVGLVGFGATSLICAIAPSAELLIAARALQGPAGAMLVPPSLALITAIFPRDERGALIMWALSKRIGALNDVVGPRVLMGCGPIVADVLPGVLLFGLGLSITVAPLTSTVLGSVLEHHAGVASGVNNQVARVAALLAIAVVGAVVAAEFESTLDERTASLPPAALVATDDARPLDGEADDGPRVDRAVESASVSAYEAGMAVGGGLVVLGGLISLIGIEHPPGTGARRRRESAKQPASVSAA